MVLPREVLRSALLFPIALCGGILGSVLMWIAILLYDHHQIVVATRRMGVKGLGAVAGGWTSLLNTPWVVLMLTIAFGLGFYLVTVVSRR